MNENGEYKARLRRLEQEREESGDRCAECGFLPGDIRLIEARSTDGKKPFLEVDSCHADWPAEKLCGTCGGLRQIEIVENF